MDILKGVVVCGCFVGSFYTWTRERLFVQTAVRDLKEAAMNPSIYVDRNDTSTIHRRVVSFTVVTVASAAHLLRVAVMGESTTADLTTFSVAEQVRLGCKSVAVTSLLFGGVLLEQYVQGRLPSLRAYWRENPLHFARDLIICPVGEELFFRGVLFSVVRLRPLKTQIAATSLLFALAHVHHVCSFAADAYRDLASEHEDATPTTARDLEAISQKALTVRAWRVALARVGVLCAITSSFGVLSGLYYTCVCERSLVATTAAHVMCNAIGPPHFSFLRTGTSGAERRWRKWIAVAYFLGIAGSITLMLCTRT